MPRFIIRSFISIILVVAFSLYSQTVPGNSNTDSSLYQAVQELKSAVTNMQSSMQKEELLTKEQERKNQKTLDSLQNQIKELKKAVETNNQQVGLTDSIEEKEAMEIGGLVTVDAYGDPNEINTAVLEIGEVDLSANVNITEGVVASINLLAEGNMSDISIDEALIAWDSGKKPFSMVFGQQYFKYGLLTTRCISDPLLIDMVETHGPGITLDFPIGKFVPSFAVTYFHADKEVENVGHINFIDSIIENEEIVTKDEANYFEGIATLDYNFTEESLARLSLAIYGDVFALDAGANCVLGPVFLDFEGYYEITTDNDDSKASGYYAGLAYGISDNVDAAIRYDGISVDSFKELYHRIGVGMLFNFKYGIFAAFEYAYNKGPDEESQEIALQLGLESTIKLPGYHRRTLTRK